MRSIVKPIFVSQTRETGTGASLTRRERSATDTLTKEVAPAGRPRPRFVGVVGVVSMRAQYHTFAPDQAFLSKKTRVHQKLFRVFLILFFWELDRVLSDFARKEKRFD
jgi:hypothetical protein